MMQRFLIASLTTSLWLGGCTDALVYGERTGLNLAIRTDVAEGQPLEFNTGFQRRVVGHVPPRNKEGGEAVNMVSAFKLKRDGADAGNAFDDKVTIETSFASGKAATSVGGNAASVQAIFDRPGVTASPKRADQADGLKISGWFGSDPVKAQEYLDFIRQSGGQAGNTGNAVADAYQTASDGRNADLNRQFIANKNL